MNDQDIKPSVAIIMGSQSDWETMKFSEEILIKLKIPFITKIISAHRTPDRMNDFAKKARENSIKVIIAGAGDVGFHLAKLLSYESQDTYIIDFDGERLNYINNHLDVITKKGDATSIKLLKEIGISTAD